LKPLGLVIMAFRLTEENFVSFLHFILSRWVMLHRN
jgi:hypothetical protein